jgi:acyl-CoA reductase-like NAD-dependent aldehyde dehydrogenase
MADALLLIDGALIDTPDHDPVIDPATGEVFASAPRARDLEIDHAVGAARRAFAGWATDEPLRRRVLAQAAAVLRANAEAIGTLITREQGRPLAAAVAEVQWSAGILDHTAVFQVEDDVISADPARTVRVTRKPLGVVAAIAPWNVPILLLVRDIAPALLAGNTVVAKPSEFTPLSTLLLGRVLADVFPAGVLNVIAGGKEVGAALTRHRDVAKVTFTGSVAGGQAVLRQVAGDLKRVSLELGGNDAAIVLADVAAATVADALFDAAFGNAGQICFAVKRVYAHRAIFNDLVIALAARAKSTRLGNGFDPDTQMGPISNRAQFERVEELVRDAVGNGAVVHSGGRPLAGPGYFYPPTIVTGIGNGTRLVDEEQFGPVLPIIPFDDIDEAIALANGSRFGLGGSVWTADAVFGQRVAERLDVGLAWVNQHARPFPGAPTGGHKWSGIGHRGGKSGYDHYVSLQVVDSVPAGSS